MANVTEIERTYLAKSIPDGLTKSKHARITDIYFPASVLHAKLRIRQKDERFEITKKTILDEANAGVQREENISISDAEFEALAKGDGRKVAKTRYFYSYKGFTAEFDVFEAPLLGLILIDFEFKNFEEFQTFTIPDFCLDDVTQEEFIAGGVLAGQTLEQVNHYLEKFNYKPLFL